MDHLTFQNRTLKIVHYQNRRWLTTVDITKALGLSVKGKGKLWQYRELFAGGMTTTMPHQTPHCAPNHIRLFSLRGALLIAALSQAQQAKAFRVFLLSVIAEPQFQDMSQDAPRPLWKRIFGHA